MWENGAEEVLLTYQLIRFYLGFINQSLTSMEELHGNALIGIKEDRDAFIFEEVHLLQFRDELTYFWPYLTTNNSVFPLLLLCWTNNLLAVS